MIDSSIVCAVRAKFLCVRSRSSKPCASSYKMYMRLAVDMSCFARPAALYRALGARCVCVCNLAHTLRFV